MLFKAQTKSIAKQPVWALVIAALSLIGLGLACSKCSRTESPKEVALSNESNDSIEAKPELLRDFLPSTCSSKQNGPKLYAQFLARPGDGQFNVNDMIGKEGSSQCAPGPFSIESSADLSQKTWQLASTPNFFVWRLNPGSVEDADLYMTNQNGFPIKSKSYTLNEEGHATLVLLPLVALESGKYYYIYLSQQNQNSKQRWIQPVSLVTKASQTESEE